MKTIINTDKAPEAIGPYSQGVVCGDLVFLSGLIPIDPETGKLEGTSVKGQAARSMQNISALLASVGLNFSNVVKVMVYLSDMKDYNSFNSIYEEYFYEPYPARSVVEVSALPKGALVEIDITAHKNI